MTAARNHSFSLGDLTRLDRIVVERPQPKHYRLNDLLAGVTEANRHAAVDFGAPASREVW